MKVERFNTYKMRLTSVIVRSRKRQQTFVKLLVVLVQFGKKKKKQTLKLAVKEIRFRVTVNLLVKEKQGICIHAAPL